jgi:hypothetical protein
MATITNTGFLDHSSNAGMRAWIADFLNTLLNDSWSNGGTIYSNIALTADTGQMTTTTLASATRPGTSTIIASNGYVIVKFNDTQAGSAPIYIKFEFGTHTSATFPAIWVTIGTGSNGSGTITGIWYTQHQLGMTADVTSTTTNRLSTSCCADGHLSIAFKRRGFQTSTTWFLAIDRTCDSTGTRDAKGVVVFTAQSGGVSSGTNGLSELTSYNVSGATTRSSTGLTDLACYWPMNITNSLLAGNAQVEKFYSCIPEIQPMIGLMSCITAEIADNATCTGAPVGSTSHTYLCLAASGNQKYTGNDSTSYGLLMLYE